MMSCRRHLILCVLLLLFDEGSLRYIPFPATPLIPAAYTLEPQGDLSTSQDVLPPSPSNLLNQIHHNPTPAFKDQHNTPSHQDIINLSGFSTISNTDHFDSISTTSPSGGLKFNASRNASQLFNDRTSSSSAHDIGYTERIDNETKMATASGWNNSSNVTPSSSSVVSYSELNNSLVGTNISQSNASGHTEDLSVTLEDCPHPNGSVVVLETSDPLADHVDPMSAPDIIDFYTHRIDSVSVTDDLGNTSLSLHRNNTNVTVTVDTSAIVTETAAQAEPNTDLMLGLEEEEEREEEEEVEREEEEEVEWEEEEEEASGHLNTTQDASLSDPLIDNINHAYVITGDYNVSAEANGSVITGHYNVSAEANGSVITGHYNVSAEANYSSSVAISGFSDKLYFIKEEAHNESQEAVTLSSSAIGYTEYEDSIEATNDYQSTVTSGDEGTSPTVTSTSVEQSGENENQEVLPIAAPMIGYPSLESVDPNESTTKSTVVLNYIDYIDSEPSYSNHYMNVASSEKYAHSSSSTSPLEPDSDHLQSADDAELEVLGSGLEEEEENRSGENNCSSCSCDNTTSSASHHPTTTIDNTDYDWGSAEVSTTGNQGNSTADIEVPTEVSRIVQGNSSSISMVPSAESTVSSVHGNYTVIVLSDYSDNITTTTLTPTNRTSERIVVSTTPTAVLEEPTGESRCGTACSPSKALPSTTSSLEAKEEEKDQKASDAAKKPVSLWNRGRSLWPRFPWMRRY
ncbi:histone H3.v1-like [Oncorhynchus tshawytscha]|uniref:histone H3.v1-like n=1 Tax=Oncorhynchus tshawytscha TaxID=74940 RepID=UPI001C3E19A4|nr:histone H3.v1-like [Oncorhynchus tshawytscha]